MSNPKRKKYTPRTEFTTGSDRPKDEQAKERMAEALAAYRGPITKCPPESELKNALGGGRGPIRTSPRRQLREAARPIAQALI